MMAMPAAWASRTVAKRAGAPATVFFPRPTPPAKAEKVARWGAQVELEGEVWDDANVAALARAKRDGLCYVHPFADREVIVAIDSKSWRLARLGKQRGDPVRFIDDRIFADHKRAEWEILKIRWQRLTDSPLPNSADAE